ncbi:hypothetical protein GC194_11430 [bacterium]|nr:hypothetical protein [bacterium]
MSEFLNAIPLNWELLFPLLLGLTYFALVKLLPLKKAITPSHQVNSLGVALIAGILLIAWTLHAPVPYFLYGLALLGLINFIDDLVNVHFAWRLMAQFSAGSFLLLQHGLYYSYWSPILLVLLVGYLNAFNFMDGINGYVGTYSLAVFLPVLALVPLDDFNKTMGWSTIIFLLVFLWFNFRSKAKVWLGDTGSIGLAFVSMQLFLSAFNGYRLYLFLVFAAVFMIDAGYTLALRQWKGINVFERHQQHLYQLITKKGRLKGYWWVLPVAAVQGLISSTVILVKNIYHQAAIAAVSVLIVGILYLIIRRNLRLFDKK